MNRDLKNLLRTVILKVLKPQWIVSVPSKTEPSEHGELGFRIGGMNFWYYKDSEPMMFTSYDWRPVHKREFGETVKSVDR